MEHRFVIQPMMRDRELAGVNAFVITDKEQQCGLLRRVVGMNDATRFFERLVRNHGLPPGSCFVSLGKAYFSRK